MQVSYWHYRLYTLLALGRVPGAERRAERVFMHLPTASAHLSTTTARLKDYIQEGVDAAIFYDLKKRHKIWSFSIVLPPADGR